jgi:hypothetical protein
MASCGNEFCDVSPKKGILSPKHPGPAGRKYRQLPDKCCEDIQCTQRNAY